MKRLLFVYLYCNLGGVTSVWKQRMPVLGRHGWSVDAIFQADYGGASDLKISGFGEVAVAGGDLASAVCRAIGTRSYEVVTLVDTPELIGPIRDCFAGRLIYEIHTPILGVLQKNRPQDLSRCDLILVPSEWSRSWVLAHFPSLDPNLLQVCPNIVSHREFRPHDAEPAREVAPEILWVGKLAPYKNWQEAARIAGLAATRRDVRLTMVTGGTVDHMRALELLTELMADGIMDRACWLHNLPLSAVGSLYRQAASSGGVLLSTSLSESFCLVIHEALRCGLPVVATRVGACPEVIQHEVSGFLYEPGDDVLAAEYVDMLVADRNLRRRLAAGSSAVLRQFGETELASRYIGLLETPP
jgi:glycosyltransferase involved in cell wall biosynthesis